MHRNIRQVIIGLCVVSAPVFAAQVAPDSRFTIKRFVVEGDSPLSAEEAQNVLQPFLGTAKSLSDLKDAAAALRRYLEAEGFPSYDVILPSQPLGSGVARLLVFELDTLDYASNVTTASSVIAVSDAELGNADLAKKPVMPGTVPVFSFTIAGFTIEGDNPLSAEEGRDVLAPFLGNHEGITVLNEAANTLERYLIDNEYSFHRVILPPQTLKDGIVRLDIIAFKIGKIDISGNKYFDDENILRSVPSLKVGDVPNTTAIAEERLHANDHPSKHIDVRFRESDVERSLNANIKVRDTRPFNVFFALNNTGSSETGDLRATLGAQYSNLFNLDQVIRLSYTFSPDNLSAVEQYGIFYSAPIYELDSDFNAFYVNSNVDSGLVGGAFDVSGAGEFAGLGYNQRLSRYGSYTHSVGINLEDKLFKNDIVFLGVPIGTDVRSRPLQATYQGAYESKGGNLNLYLSYAHNIQSGSNNDDLSYTLARFGANPDWGAFRFGGEGNMSLPDNWTLRGRFDGQYASEPLIPGEQFGIGGYYSVRGYEEREESGDSGAFASAEIWTPEFPYNMRLFGFVDYGYVHNDQPLPGEETNSDLLGAGVGLHWLWRSNVSFNIDVAHAFISGPLTEAGENKVNFNLLLRY